MKRAASPASPAATRLAATMLAAIAVVVGVVGSSSAVQAQPRGLQGRASLEIDLDVASQTDDEMSERETESSMGVAVRALVGKHHVFYGVGFGYRLGAVVPGGFLYRAEVFPVGVGTGVSDVVHLGVFAGAGFSGVTSRVPVAAIFPVEARVDLRIGKRVAIGGYARAVWTPNDARNRGAPSSDRVDELGAGVRLRWSRYYRIQGKAFGTDGYYLAALVDERLGARFIGGAFGYSLDMGLK